MKQQEFIAIEKIKPNKYQPRLAFEDDTIYELAQSIKQNGLIQPMVVRPDGDFYEIIAGERRYRAMMMLGMHEVPVIIHDDVDDNKSATLALIENIQRENLNAFEEAKAYKEILEIEGITQTELAKRLGKSQSSIANKIRLLELPETVLKSLHAKEITERHARALLSVEKEKIDNVLEQIKKYKLNVKDTENLIKKETKPKAPVTKGLAGHIKIGINSLKRSIEMIEQTGIKLTHDVKETDDEVIVTIRFPK